MKHAPKLTVIIPTCNRPDTLRSCLATVVAQRSPEIQILVSDNFSDAETRRVIESFPDPRIHAVRTDRKLGMSEHWDFALEHACGEWVTIIGDDDGLLPDGTDRFFDLAACHNVNAICSLRCNYTWPGASHDGLGRLQVMYGEKFEIRNSEEWLRSTVTSGGNYMDLPWIYTGGFVKRAVMDQIRHKMGRCFCSIIPDVYSGVAVASVVPVYGYSHFPFAVNGTSAHSNGRQCLNSTRNERTKIDFFQDNGLKFLENLGDGFINSFCFYTYESFLQSAPLRDFQIDTTLDDQLFLAMLQAKKSNYQDVVDYCRDVAIRNDINFGPIAGRCKRARIRQYIYKKLGKIIPLLRKTGDYHKINIKSKELATVMLAAQAAGRLLADKSSSANA